LVSAALSYSGIVFSAILGIVVFEERLPVLAWFGIALIVAAGMMALRFAPRRPGPDALATND
jgi:S-adenosylmethionine uptake transporter